MSIVRGPSDWDREERSERAEHHIPRKRARGIERRIGRGSLACPSCSLPVVSGEAIPIAARVRCPFCRAIHPARSFLRLDTPDTTLNEVSVTARLP
jgi:hypothetical protein